MDRNGTTLGDRYRLGAKIGTGGMSDVYAATDELLGRDVAVKMMRPDLARDHTFLERFRREAQNAAKLNHPAIVAVYDTGQTSPADGEVPYIVMERVYGETLRDIIQDHGKMRLNDAASVMSRVADALHFSHEAGIIHRDIKPANIMITNTGAVKVMDFGIARALSDSSAAMTQTAAVIGTAQYLSPEQARGKSADSRSDIYATGCVFYELATGRPPFEGESPFSVAFQHVQDEPTPPSKVPGMHLSHREAISLDAIALYAMAKNPTDRYDDAAEMATDLHRLSEDQLPLVAQAYAPDDATTSVMPSSGNGTGGAHAAAAGTAGAAGAHALADRHNDEPGMASGMEGGQPPAGRDLPAHDPEREPEYYEAEDRHRNRWWIPVLWTLVVLGVVGGGAFAAYHYLSQDKSPAPAQQTNVKVPDVANLPRAEAEQKLKDAGLKVDSTDRPDANIPRNNAIGTEPGADSTVPSGTRVNLLVSTGKEITDIPDLTGMTTSQARDALQQAGLELNPTVKEQPSKDVPKGQVITQNPAQGSQVSKGTKVSITVSTGVEQVRVPNVTGQNLDGAKANLEAAGFTVNTTLVDSEKPENTVLSASQEGSELPRGSEVQLQVSKGNLFSMPNLKGKTYSEVLQELQQAGWRGSPDKLSRHNTNTSNLPDVDKISDQSVQPGAMVNRDSAITVGVYVFSLLP